jgi:hypothetical protein
VPTVSQAFSLRPQHVVNYTVNSSTSGSTVTFSWSFTITTSGNTQQPFGTGSYNNSTISLVTGLAATTYTGGTNNNTQSFGFDYRGTVASGLRNRTYTFGGGTRTAPVGTGDYRFRLDVDMAGLIGSSNNIDIVMSSGSPPTPAPSWTTTSFSEIARVGSSVLYGVSATNATSYAIASGSLPPGLSFDSGGFIFGTATAGLSQAFPFVVRATGAGGSTNSSTFFLTRLQPLPAWTDNTLSTTNLRVGTPYSDSVTASNASSYSVSGLPAGGLSFDASTRTVSGTPTSTSNFVFSITARNTDNDSINQSYSFTPKPPLPVFTDATLATTTVKKNSNYADGVVASSAASYSISSGALPAGILLDTTTGEIEGVPTTVGTSTFKVTARNSANETVQTGDLTITVEPAGSGKVWNGTAWIQAPFKVWSGTAWVEAPAKVWNGTAWADPTS